MKKSIRTLVLFMAVALGVVLASGTTSRAAAWAANLQQTNQTSSYVTLTWTANTDVLAGNGHYRIYLSDTGAEGTWKEVNWVGYTSTSTNISGLNAGYVGFARVAAYVKGHSASTDADLVATSDAIAISTVPNVPKVENLKQTGATSNSITMQWDAVTNATGYTVYQYVSSGNYVKLGDTSETTYTVSGLAESASATYFVTANQMTAAGLTGTSEYFNRVDMKTTPAKVTGNRITSISDSTASYRWDTVTYADGYQFQLQNYKGKTLTTKETTSYGYYLSSVSFKRGIFNKYRVRAFIVVNGKKIYGTWSNYNYFALPTKSSSAVKRTSAKKITVKWGKVAGASGYDVYVSTTSSSGGFKKIKSLSSKKTKYVITKIGKKSLKKNKRYYVRLLAKCKVGKKTVKSEVYAGNVLSV